MSKKKKYNENSAIRASLRRTFSRSPIVREVLNAGRREVPRYKKDGTVSNRPAVQYHCQGCDGWVSSTNIYADHIEPVIRVNGTFIDWDDFISRLFCDIKNIQRLCGQCHDVKTSNERKARKENQRSK
jgi:hypothetical protein